MLLAALLGAVSGGAVGFYAWGYQEHAAVASVSYLSRGATGSGELADRTVWSPPEVLVREAAQIRKLAGEVEKRGGIEFAVQAAESPPWELRLRAVSASAITSKTFVRTLLAGYFAATPLHEEVAREADAVAVVGVWRDAVRETARARAALAEARQEVDESSTTAVESDAVASAPAGPPEAEFEQAAAVWLSARREADAAQQRLERLQAWPAPTLRNSFR